MKSSGSTLPGVGADGLGDLQTVEALAGHLGYDVTRTEALLASAGVAVFDRVFSVSALRARLGAPSSKSTATVIPDARSPQGLDPAPSTESLVQAALAKSGLRATGLLQRRGLVGELQPRLPDREVVFYSAVPLDVRERMRAREDEDDPGTVRDVDTYFADEDLLFSKEYPRKARVFTTRAPTSGAYHFTIGRDKTSEPLDVVVLLALDTGRAWMIKVDDLRDVVEGTRPMSHVHIHKATGALRLTLPLRRSVYDLDNRLMVRPRPENDG